jgi:hypothetical protein
MPKRRVLVDTCIIIEAFRTGMWNALCARFAVETVEKCIEEACTGDPLDPRRTPIDRVALVKGLAQRHTVSDLDLATLAIERSDLPGLDDGELHLMAWLHANRPVDVTLLISTTDAAAARAVHQLKLLDQLGSLESLGKEAGASRQQMDAMAAHYREAWMSALRMRLMLDVQ